ncbi:MAG: DUF4173 domain-containing protein [Clostridia bacterium]|nr:DUF4173 domain-containing protein [Clostridia bacterium]
MEDLSTARVEDSAAILKRENIYMLLGSILLGLVFDFLFYGKPFGVSYPIFTVVFYVVLFFNARGRISIKFDFGWFLIIPILALSLVYSLFSSEVFSVLNFLAIPMLLIIQTILITKTNKHSWFVLRFLEDIIWASLINTLSNILKPFRIISLITKFRVDSGKNATLKKVLIGLVISIPLLLVITILLASADQVFANLVGDLPDVFTNIGLGEVIAHTILILVITVFSFGYIFGLLNPIQRYDNPSHQKQGRDVRILDNVIIITILSLINIIYVVFVMIQFSYLFGGASLPDGFTYSEYARRGFFELNLVTLINFSILLSSINFTKKGSAAVNRAMQILHSLVVANTLIMLLSAHLRMALYEEAYGYTHLRILTHAFMAFLFVLFIVTLIKIWNEKISLLKAYIVIAVISYVIINYANVDVIIAKNNIERYYKTQQIDAAYLSSLSYDAVPELTRLLNDKNKGVAAQIENGLYLKKEKLDEEKSWQSFNYSKYRAKKELDKYKLNYTEGLHYYRD